MFMSLVIGGESIKDQGTLRGSSVSTDGNGAQGQREPDYAALPYQRAPKDAPGFQFPPLTALFSGCCSGYSIH